MGFIFSLKGRKVFSYLLWGAQAHMEVQKEEAHTDGEAILVFGLEFRVGI